MGYSGIGLNIPGAGIISIAFLTPSNMFNIWQSGLVWLLSAVIGAFISAFVLIGLKFLKQFKTMYQISSTQYFRNYFSKIGKQKNINAKVNFINYKINYHNELNKKNKENILKKLHLKKEILVKEN